jgi:predicted PurR-regulated permease PerM
MNDNTVTLSPHATFWVLFLGIGLLVVLVFSPILLPFAAGMVIAYLFHPVVNRMCRLGIARGVSAFTIIAVVTLALALAIATILPPVLDQLSALIQNAPRYGDQLKAYIEQNFAQYLEPVRKQIDAGPQATDQGAQNISQHVAQNLVPWALAQAQRLLANSLAIFNSIALFFITPVVAFFMMRDWDSMIKAIDKFLPRQDAPTIRKLAGEIDWTISSYLRGTFIVLIILSAFYMVTLGAIGLNYGLLIGLAAGLISFIPYLGSTSGFLVAGGVAVAQYWPNYSPILLVLGVFVFGQMVEGNILTPKIVGDKVRLHPVWLLFALIASGYLLGFTGLLIAVPLAAAIGVLVRHMIDRYYHSPMYREADHKSGHKLPT